MPDQKIDNLLNLAMDATSEERAKSENLNVGYDSSERLWDVIVKYSGPESGLGGEGIQVVPLLGLYRSRKSRRILPGSRLNLLKNLNDCILKPFRAEKRAALCRFRKGKMVLPEKEYWSALWMRE